MFHITKLTEPGEGRVCRIEGRDSLSHAGNAVDCIRQCVQDNSCTVASYDKNFNTCRLFERCDTNYMTKASAQTYKIEEQKHPHPAIEWGPTLNNKVCFKNLNRQKPRYVHSDSEDCRIHCERTEGITSCTSKDMYCYMGTTECQEIASPGAKSWSSVTASVGDKAVANEKFEKRNAKMRQMADMDSQKVYKLKAGKRMYYEV